MRERENMRTHIKHYKHRRDTKTETKTKRKQAREGSDQGFLTLLLRTARIKAINNYTYAVGA